MADDPVQTWGNKLTSEELNEIRNIFSNAEKADSTFSTISLTFHYFKPWAVFGLLSTAKAQSDFKYVEGMDTTFHLKVRQEGETLIGLETLQDRVQALGLPNISDEDALVEIKNLLKDKGNEKDDSENNGKTDAIYLRGSLEELEAYEWATCEDDKYINMKTSYKRNITMNKNFFGHIEPKKPAPSLIGVQVPFLRAEGVAHLIGKGGFLNNDLVKATFNIKRISNEGVAEDFTYTPER